MVYNDKYFLEFDTLKTADSAIKYYRVLFSKLEETAQTYTLVEMQGSNAPFVLTYRSAENNAFSPIKTSAAEINVFYPLNPIADLPTPDTFFSASSDYEWRVQLYEITDNGATSTLKWQGYIVDSDIQYEWQDIFYYRLTATDNLSVLKDKKYTASDAFRCPTYDPTTGILVKDYIIELVNFAGNLINYKMAWNMNNDSTAVKLADIYTSKYNGVDWTTYQPKNVHDILKNLLDSIGAILYLDNNDCSWTVLNVSEVGTRTGNLVPYELYDYATTYISSGDLDLNSSINTGGTDLVWRDTNQIVTLNKPYGKVQFKHKYIPKNLLANYGFGQDLSHTDWYDYGTFLSDTEATAYARTGINYDKNLVKVTSSEANTSLPLDTSNFFYQNINIEDSKVITTNSNERWAIYTEIDTYLTSPTTSVNEGFNYQLKMVDIPNSSTYQFEFSNQADIDAGGNWYKNRDSWIPVFANNSNPYTRVKTFTKYIPIQNSNPTLAMNFLKYRYDPLTSSSGAYYIDNIRLNITPLSYRSVTDLGFVATLYPDRATLEKETYFNGGVNESDWYVFEGALGLKDVVTNTFYCNALWDRHFDIHDESSFNYLNAIVAKSILSFYRGTSRRITGNIYGEDISYPKYFEVQGSSSIGIYEDIYKAFEARVLADAGTIETALCGSDFLREFYDVPAKFLMVEATFDYANSTTSVNIHEDLTNEIETDFEAGFGGFTFGNGIFPQQFGSTTSGQLEVTTG
jgi:hypothetical protein